MNGLDAMMAHDATCKPEEKWLTHKGRAKDANMGKWFYNYLLNSIKVAILGFLWFILFQVPWESLPNAPIGGKILVGVMLWAIWSFMVNCVQW